MLLLQVKESDGWHTLNRREFSVAQDAAEMQMFLHHWQSIMPMGTFRIIYQGKKGA